MKENTADDPGKSNLLFAKNETIRIANEQRHYLPVCRKSNFYCRLSEKRNTLFAEKIVCHQCESEIGSDRYICNVGRHVN